MAKNKWTREELILALSVYFQLPFSKLSTKTAEVQELGELIGRGANSAALRLVNFAACDPYILSTGRHGMDAGKGVCMPIWDEFAEDKERLFREAAEIKANLQNKTIEQSLHLNDQDFEGKERTAVIHQRIGQDAFRRMILNNYNSTCAVTGINDPRLLIASHIIPWKDKTDTRLNPENGICLSALYDKAFDEGLISVRPDDLTLIYSKSLKDSLTVSSFQEQFAKYENKQLIKPEEHAPAVKFLEYHLKYVFLK